MEVKNTKKSNEVLLIIHFVTNTQIQPHKQKYKSTITGFGVATEPDHSPGSKVQTLKFSTLLIILTKCLIL